MKCPDCGLGMVRATRIKKGIDPRLLSVCIKGSETLMEQGWSCSDILCSGESWPSEITKKIVSPLKAKPNEKRLECFPKH